MSFRDDAALTALSESQPERAVDEHDLEETTEPLDRCHSDDRDGLLTLRMVCPRVRPERKHLRDRL